MEEVEGEGGRQRETGENVDLMEREGVEVKNTEKDDLKEGNCEKENLEEAKHAPIATACEEQEPKRERLGPILMFSTLGRNEEYEEEEEVTEEKLTEEDEDLTDEENEVKELEMELEELDSALQKGVEKKEISIADICDQLDEIDCNVNEDNHENKVYDSFEEKLQNIFNVR